MSLILHHFLKSVRSLRWILGLWILIIGVQAAMTVLAVQPNYKIARLPEMIGTSGLWYFLNGVAWTAVIVYLVQSEPVTGGSSFWLTRPIPPLISVLSKLLFILGLVVVLSLIPKTLDLLVFGVPFPQIEKSIGASTLLQLMMLPCVLWLSTYTRNLGQFAGVVGVLFVLFTSFTMAMAFSGGAIVITGGTPAKLLVSRWEMASLTFLGGLITSLVIQYFSRTTKLAFLLGLGSILLSIVFAKWWPFVLPTLWHEKPAANAELISLNYQLDATKPFAWNETQLLNTTYRNVSTPLIAPAETPQGNPLISSISSSFRPDGGKEVSLPASYDSYSAFTPDQMDWLSQLRLANPLLQIPGEPRPVNELIPTFMVTPDLVAKLKEQTGTLQLQIHGDFVQLRKRVEIPLHGDRFARIPQALVRIIAIQDEKTELRISVEEAGYLDTQQWKSTPTVYLLVDPVHRIGIIPEKTAANEQNTFGGGSLVRTSSQFLLQASAQGESVDDLVLYVYEVVHKESFHSEVKVPHYTFHPGEH